LTNLAGSGDDLRGAASDEAGTIESAESTGAGAMTGTTMVSIVIPVRNEGRTLRSCLESLFAQDHHPIEVIIVNDGSTDDTGDIVASYGERIQLLSTPGVGPSRGRNLGVARATGDYVAFTDGDCVCGRSWIRELLRGFNGRPDVAGVGGSQRTPPDDSPYGRQVGAFLRAFGFASDYIRADGKEDIVEVNHNPTCNVLYRRTVFNRVGGFLESLWPGEDVEFDLRVRRCGLRLMYNACAIVYHHRPDTPAKFRRMMRNYGEAQGKLLRMYGPFRTIQFLPAALLVGGILAGMMALVPLLLLGTGALAAGALALLLHRRTPDTRTAVACAAMLGPAIWEWNRGYLKGIRQGAGQRARVTT
jgi:GT2 family glycosyltransferase